MSKKKPKDRSGVVYSTNPDFQYASEADDTSNSLPASMQKIRLRLEKKHRGGKEVTLASGFVLSQADLEDLARRLKQKVGTGGSVVDGEILIQGDQRAKVKALLEKEGFRT